MKKLLGLFIMVAVSGSAKGESMELCKNETMKSHPAVITGRAVKVVYRNYRGEIATRSIVPLEVYWGQTEFHPHDQWLLKVWDVEKDAERIYAFKDIQKFDAD